jgi:hypothetical protein
MRDPQQASDTFSFYLRRIRSVPLLTLPDSLGLISRRSHGS